MKRLIVALILAVVLTVTFAAPALAWGPPNPPDLPEPGEEGIWKAGFALAHHAWSHAGINKGKGWAIGPCVPWNFIFNHFLGAPLPNIYN